MKVIPPTYCISGLMLDVRNLQYIGPYLSILVHVSIFLFANIESLSRPPVSFIHDTVFALFPVAFCWFLMFSIFPLLV